MRSARPLIETSEKSSIRQSSTGTRFDLISYMLDFLDPNTKHSLLHCPLLLPLLYVLKRIEILVVRQIETKMILPVRCVKNQSSPWTESACLLIIGLKKTEDESLWKKTSKLWTRFSYRLWSVPSSFNVVSIANLTFLIILNNFSRSRSFSWLVAVIFCSFRSEFILKEIQTFEDHH